KTVDRDESRFWAGSAAEAITVEEGMHEDLLADSRLAAAYSELSGGSTASPTTLGYVSFLVATAASRSHGECVAGALPCFLFYALMGKVLSDKAGQMDAEYA